jgi:hypothetical protein
MAATITAASKYLAFFFVASAFTTEEGKER